MGRTLKRVPLDFGWPHGKVWKGYINPHYKPCPEAGKTCFNGENAAAKYLGHISSMLTVIGDDAHKGTTHPYCKQLPYYSDHPDWSIQPKEVRQKMVDFVEKLTGMKKGFLGFGGSGFMIYFNLLKMAGIENPEGGKEKPAYDWSHCGVCNGEDLDPAVKEKHDAWKDFEPPTGEGFQLWETTSEGSPTSPVFASLDDLCAWAEKNSSTFADCKATAADWKKMLEKDFVHAQMGNVIML